MFDCTCNIQNSLLLNQHNGDDAPQDSYNIFTRNEFKKKTREIYKPNSTYLTPLKYFILL